MAIHDVKEIIKEARSGTTTVGLICEDGVIVAADKKAAAYYVENRYERKVFQINERVAITTAGMVGDLQYLTRVIKAEAALHEVRAPQSKMTARSVSTLLSNILQNSRYYPYMVMLLVAGFDEGPALYSVDPVGGVTQGEKIFTTGSGGPIAMGVLEAYFKEGMNTAEGTKLAIKALKAAAERDMHTGGKGFNLVVINKHGIKDFSEEEITKLAAA